MKSTQYASKYPPVYNAPCVGSQIVPFALFQDRVARYSRYPMRSREGCRGTGSIQRQPQLLHLLPRSSTVETRYKNQLTASKQQHRNLCCHLSKASAQVTLHTTLLGVGGVIYTPHTLESLKELGGSGIVIGLSTYGYNIIKVLGVQLAKITPARGFR
eukprot:1136635-Pelagomonas_calceolata.AAC.7